MRKYNYGKKVINYTVVLNYYDWVDVEIKSLSTAVAEVSKEDGIVRKFHKAYEIFSKIDSFKSDCLVCRIEEDKILINKGNDQVSMILKAVAKILQDPNPSDLIKHQLVSAFESQLELTDEYEEMKLSSEEITYQESIACTRTGIYNSGRRGVNVDTYLGLEPIRNLILGSKSDQGFPTTTSVQSQLDSLKLKGSELLCEVWDQDAILRILKPEYLKLAQSPASIKGRDKIKELGLESIKKLLRLEKLITLTGEEGLTLFKDNAKYSVPEFFTDLAHE